jgi:hypothetical protein
MDGGAHWIKDELRESTPTGVSYCVVGALEAAAPNYAAYDTARRAVRDAVGGSVDRWNNRPTTTYQDVTAALSTARGDLLRLTLGVRGA